MTHLHGKYTAEADAHFVIVLDNCEQLNVLIFDWLLDKMLFLAMLKVHCNERNAFR